MFLGAAMTEVFRNLFISYIVDEHNCLVSEQLIGMPLEILGDSLGGICCKVILLQTCEALVCYLVFLHCQLCTGTPGLPLAFGEEL